MGASVSHPHVWLFFFFFYFVSYCVYVKSNQLIYWAAQISCKPEQHVSEHPGLPLGGSFLAS